MQTHHFVQTLDTYRIGMIVPQCPILTGIRRYWTRTACSAQEVGHEV